MKPLWYSIFMVSESITGWQNTQTLKVKMSELNNLVQETLKPKTEKENEQEIIDQAKAEFFAKGGEVKKTNPASSGRKRTSKRKTANNKGKKNAPTVGGRKPVLNCWKMLNIKVGAKLVWIDGGKTCDKTSAVVLDDFSMKLEVCYGKKKKTVDGLMRGEIFARSMKKLPCPKKPQGWDKWGIMKDGKPVSIHSIYDSTTREQLLKRRGY